MLTEDHDFQSQTVTHWTDSMMVLQRLHSARKSYQVLVANRFGEILYQSTVDERRHVKAQRIPRTLALEGHYVTDAWK